jgi:hypothetical protein
LNKKKLIEVCDECWQASCWYGEFLCDESMNAGTVLLPIGVLTRLALEHPSYWSETKLVEVYGTTDPHPLPEKRTGTERHQIEPLL